ncbi:MAG: YdeI/OmpD-associated family protein [bacterium]|nr:YdeI/OmpD-associated family protein [bacterium]MDE0437981.1 YdeI/OmpD-associated family protein [bacterium]
MRTYDGSTPEDLAAALDSEPEARDAFRRLPPSHRREYLDWIGEAKRLDTRHRRIEKTIRMLHG